jgi:DNA mismatch repair protein MutS
MSTKTKSLTPLMRQYHKIKDEHEGAILLFRVGDFYETFADDAELVSRELGITLTKRNNGSDQTPLDGYPYHALDTYLPKLVKKGYRVAVCEQVEEPSEAKNAGRKVVNREVTEITTPGVTMSEKLLEHKRNNYAAAVFWSGDTAGASFADVSTGEFALCEVPKEQLGDLLQSINPAELLLPQDLKNNVPGYLLDYNMTFIENWVYEGDYGYNLLTDHFETHSLKGFGVEDKEVAHVAAGALMHYIQETQKASLGHIKRLQKYENNEYMSLDGSTKRNLELITTIQEGGNSEGTLISILDETCTAMGGRMLRKWIMRPLKRMKPIRARLNAVEALNVNHEVRENIQEELDQVGDLERLISRICVGRANPRDLISLKDSLGRVPLIKMQFNQLEEPLLNDILERLKLLIEVQEDIEDAIVEDPPTSVRDGDIFKDGYNDELDELRNVARNGKDYIAETKDQLAAETGIDSLKIGYNKVYGYYIEVTNTHAEKVPDHFIRKQTLVNSERYITPELKEVEEKILSSEEQSKTLEYELFEELRIDIAGYAEEIQQVAEALAELDCLQSFAEISYHNNYCKPAIADDQKIDITKGRHPVVEKTLPPGDPFIPNDMHLENEDEQILIITGPNMAGKSIILRQTGLIVLLAQIGCFVPAEEAHIGLVDKIFTRVGASDNLAAGESTFLVEMNEAANILNNATRNSLILLDEVGRGTSTFDGLSIAWALAEYLHNQPSVAAKTLFATHYHELNELENMYEHIVNYNVSVKEHDDKVIFLRKLVRGGADHSYGIQVADMAGLPSIVIERAKEILSNLESHSLDLTDSNGTLEEGAKKKKKAVKKAAREMDKQDEITQPSLFQTQLDPNTEQLIDKLEACDPNRMTPIESLMLVSELKKLVENRS